MTTGQHRRSQAGAAEYDGAVHHLDRDLKRHQARARRAWRRYRTADEEGNPSIASSAHRAWSDAIDDALGTADAISRQRSGGLGELLIVCEAILWWIREDDNVLDGGSRRWLGRFRRSLRRLADEK